MDSENQGYGLKDVLVQSKNLATDFLNDDYERLIKLLKQISNKVKIVEEEKDGVSETESESYSNSMSESFSESESDAVSYTEADTEADADIVTNTDSDTDVEVKVNKENKDVILIDTIPQPVTDSESDSISGITKLDSDSGFTKSEQVNPERIESTLLPVVRENIVSIKRRSRSFMSSFTDSVVNVNRVNNCFLIAHLTKADLSMFNDFKDFKSELSIVNNCFVTLSKKVLYDTNVIIRDTMLLTPSGSKSLDTVGKMHGIGFEKIDDSKIDKSNMDVVLRDHPELFKTYAVKDSVITLVHANKIEDQSFKSGVPGIPISLSQLTKIYIKDR